MMNFRSISLIHFDKCFHGKCRTVSAQIIIVVRLQTSKNDLLQQYSQITNMALCIPLSLFYLNVRGNLRCLCYIRIYIANVKCFLSITVL